MSTEERLREERDFHDRQAELRALTFDRHPETLMVDDHVYLNHETWIRPAMARLGAGPGIHVLDYGCGHGMASVVLARSGARVTAFDLSGGYVAEVARRARANMVRIDVVQADGARLPFADEIFDRVWGNAILHHLDAEAAGRELFRVLRPGGCAVFCEPWGGNPFLRWARKLLPYQGKERTSAEEPLRSQEIGALRALFPSLSVEGHQLLGMARRLLKPGLATRWLDRGDRTLLQVFPFLNRLTRYVVLTLRKLP